MTLKRSLVVTLLFIALVAANAYMPEFLSGTWQPAGSMSAERSGAASVLLPDGSVLVIGGSDANGPTASVDSFSGAAFSAAAPMNSPRTGHTATLLADGRVLVTGGNSGSGAVNSAEVYDPTSGSWSTLGSAMIDARSGHSATLLEDGTVLLIGGGSSSVELFNPSSDTFSYAGSLNSARSGHGAALLKNGSVLVAGGADADGHALASVEIFNPATGMSTNAAPLSVPRNRATATTDVDGWVVVIGGNDGTNDLGGAELYSPASGDWTVRSGGTPRSAHLAILLPHNNNILVVGGTSAGNPLASAQLYETWTDTFKSTGAMSAARAGATLSELAVSGQVVVAGGSGNASAETYYFATIMTDQADYAPGEMVYMAGGGWKPGEQVALQLHEVQVSGNVIDHSITPVTADSFGNITYSEYAPTPESIGAHYHLTAVGQTSGLESQTVFSDGNLQSVITFGIGPTSVAPGATLNFTASATCDNGGGQQNTCAGNGFTQGGPVADTYSMDIQQSTSSNFNQNLTPRDTVSTTGGTVSDSFTAPATPGTYFYRARHSSQQIGSNSWQPQNSNTISITVVAGPTATTTSVNSSANPSIYGNSVTFTATVSPNAGSNGTLTFNDGATPICTAVPLSGSQATCSTSTLAAGGHSITAVYSGGGGFGGSTSTALSQTVNKANQTITWADPADITYGTLLSGTQLNATVAGVAGGSAPGALTYTPAAGTQLNAGNGQVLQVDAAATSNYNSATKTVHINVLKANQTITFGALGNKTYGDADFSVSATGGASGNPVTFAASGNCTVTGTSVHISGAGSCTITASQAGNSNYNAAADVPQSFSIAKANAVISVTGYSVTYNGAAHTATGSATGVLGESLAGLDLSGTTHTNAGDYPTDPWTFTDVTGNYNNASGTTHDHIDKANATIVVTPYSLTYDGDPHTASGTAKGVKNEALAGLDLTGTTHTNAGDYPNDPWAFTDVTGNYNNASGTTHDHIDKANATIVVTPYSVTYDTDPHTATGTAKGVKNEDLTGLDLSGTTHTNAGDYPNDPWVFTDVTGNYNNASGTKHDHIDKANATITVTPYSLTYDGDSHTATGTAKGVKNEDLTGLDLSGTTHTNAGDYPTDSWTFTNANYNDASGTVHDHIDKANATIVVTPYSVTYDTDPHMATGTAKGVKNEALAGLDLTGTTHTNAGDYPNDPWTFTDVTGNYNNASGTTHDHIDKADPTISVNGYTGVYDGDPHGATGTATGVKGESLAGLNLGAQLTNVPGGTANWTFTDVTGNYNNKSGSVAITISKADPTISVNGYTGVYDGDSHGATGTAKGVKGESLVGLNLGASFTNVPGGTANWTFTDVTRNYNDKSGSVAINISKADPTISVTPYSVAYDSNSHTATGTAKGVKNEPLAGLNLTGTTHTNPGDYPNDPWTFTDVTGNYNNKSGSVHDIIIFGTCSSGDGGKILPPINSDGTSIYNRKGGSTIPVKFKVCGANGLPITNAAAVFGPNPPGAQVTMLSAMRGNVTGVIEADSADIPDSAFTWDGQQWHFNMATKNLDAPVTYTFRINLAYGPGVTFTVSLK